MHMKGRHRRSRKAVTTVYAIILLTGLAGFASLAVDYGRAQLAKTELRAAVDAAARAGASVLSNSDADAARSAAITFAGHHQASGSQVVLTAPDVEIGNFNNGVFTVNGTPSNSVRVTAARTKARGNPIPLTFASLIGVSTCDVTVSATATGTPSMVRGLVGLSGIDVKNNTVVASYNSSVYTDPSSGSAGSNASLGSNGQISGGNNNNLQGSVILGPSGSVDSHISVSGSTSQQSTSITAPTMPAWTPETNPNNIPQNYNVSGSTTLAGGTYWFTSLTINGSLSFSGKATVYVNGNVNLSGSLAAYGAIPSNLVIYQLGTNRTFGSSTANGMDITAVIIAPTSDFSAKNNLIFRGSGFFKSITVWNNAQFYYDESMGAAAGGVDVTLVK